MAPAELARLERNLQDERDGARLYHALARAEDDPRLAEVYERLARDEERHASVWLSKLHDAGATAPRDAPSFRARALAFLARRGGAGMVAPFLPRLERADRGKYAGQADAAELARDESSHARVLAEVARGRGGMGGASVARAEAKHALGGNALRAGVLGANDGLVSNLSLVMGVAGAELANGAILVTGLAGLLAGASSMALGEWLSVQSSRELYAHQIATERAELEAEPEAEVEELALIYESRGLAADKALEAARATARNPDATIEALAREELGIDPQELGGSAWQAAIISFGLFAMGAIVPVLAFFFTRGLAAVAWSVGLSGVGLFALGAATSLFTGRGPLYSGGRQVLFGLAAAALTFGIGRLVGAGLAG